MTPKKKPMIFNTEMVRAIVDGRKTETRRLIKAGYRNRPFEVGDTIYVRETFTVTGIYTNFDESGRLHTVLDQTHGEQFVVFKEAVESQCIGTADIRWWPAIHMKTEDARIFLEVTSIEPQRIQDITATDILNEGVAMPYEYHPLSDYDPQEQLRKDFIELWDSVVKHGQDRFEANPLVWVIKFKVKEIKV